MAFFLKNTSAVSLAHQLCISPFRQSSPFSRRLFSISLSRCNGRSSMGSIGKKSVVAVLQFTATADKARNLEQCENLILQAKAQGATVSMAVCASIDWLVRLHPRFWWIFCDFCLRFTAYFAFSFSALYLKIQFHSIIGGVYPLHSLDRFPEIVTHSLALRASGVPCSVHWLFDWL